MSLSHTKVGIPGLAAPTPGPEAGESERGPFKSPGHYSRVGLVASSPSWFSKLRVWELVSQQVLKVGGF